METLAFYQGTAEAAQSFLQQRSPGLRIELRQQTQERSFLESIWVHLLIKVYQLSQLDIGRFGVVPQVEDILCELIPRGASVRASDSRNS